MRATEPPSCFHVIEERRLPCRMLSLSWAFVRSEKTMSPRRGAFKPIALVLLGLVVVGAVVVGVVFGLPLVRDWAQPAAGAESKSPAPAEPGVSLPDKDHPDRIEVPDKIAQRL